MVLGNWGSGIWFYMGKTIVFQEHVEAYSFFKVAPTSTNPNEAMSLAAAAAGYDSIQFMAHVDHVNYPCDTYNTHTPNLQYMGVEIVGTRLVGTYACCASDGAPSTIRAGWQASRTCTCDNSDVYLNCEGVPRVEDQRPAAIPFARPANWSATAAPA